MQDKDFKIITRATTGRVYIRVNTQYNNINASYVIIGENVTARLYGKVKKKLVLKKGSKLYLHGSVSGTIENEGGEIQIFSRATE